MNLCRFSTDPITQPAARSGPGIYYGSLEGSRIRVIEGDPFSDYRLAGKSYVLEEVRLLPPCLPSKIVCVGRNYVEHARELQNEAPAEPLIFFKPPSSVLASGDAIVYPPESKRVDHEGEIGVVIGRRCRRLGPEQSVAPFIYGYTCVNDVTARDLQKKDGQWTRGKGFDTFCPFGPVIATEADPAKLEVRLKRNGEIRQCGSVSQMIFPVDAIVRYISQVMTLEPGDLIATGTPAGVGPLEIGDALEVTVEGVGTLHNVVVGG